MKRRTALALILAPLILVTTGIWHQYLRRPSSMETDLKSQQVEDAVKILRRERLMWSRLDKMSGRINVAVKSEAVGNGAEPISLTGDVSLREIEFSPLAPKPWRYVMTLSDTNGSWSVRTDGTSENTKISGQDKKILQAIEAAGPDHILELLTIPRQLLVPLYKDKLFPQGKLRLDQLISEWNPYLHPQAGGAPHSYSFKAKVNSGNELDFLNGHFSGWRKKNPAGGPDLVLSLREPVVSGGFWYPTEIQFKKGDTEYMIQLSQVSAVMK